MSVVTREYESLYYGLEVTHIVITFYVGVFIICGNSFVLLALKLRPTLRTPLNTYVGSICVSGIITGFLAFLQIGFYIGPVHYQHPTTWFYSCEFRQWTGIAFWAASTNAILCMLAIAVERYRILFHKVSPRRSGIVAVCIAVVSVVYNGLMFGLLPPTFVIVNSMNPREIWGPWKKAENGHWIMVNESGAQISEESLLMFPFAKHCHFNNFCNTQWVYLVNFLLAFAIPFVAILVLYQLLSAALLQSAASANHKGPGMFTKGISTMTATLFRSRSTLRTFQSSKEINNLQNVENESSLQRKDQRRSDRLRAVRGMKLAVIAFFACWLPANIMLVHVGIDHGWHTRDRTHGGRDVLIGHLDWVHKLLHDIGVQVILAHNWIHLLIYPAYNRQFKKELISLKNSMINFILRRENENITTISVNAIPGENAYLDQEISEVFCKNSRKANRRPTYGGFSLVVRNSEEESQFNRPMELAQMASVVAKLKNNGTRLNSESQTVDSGVGKSSESCPEV